MTERNTFMEVLRWGLVQIPAAVYHYASELDLEPEDLGVLGAAFYSYTHRCQPLLQKDRDWTDYAMLSLIEQK